jgi:hypothetical protein
MKAINITLLTFTILPTALAFCCGITWGGCLDGNTYGTPCCATGPCNLFCCACSGCCRGPGCSKPPKGLMELDEHDDTANAFILADKNGNGYITLDQYLDYMNVTGKPDIWTNWFYKWVTLLLSIILSGQYSWITWIGL